MSTEIVKTSVLVRVREHCGFRTPHSFSKEIGIANTTIVDAEKAGRPPSERIIHAVIQKFPKINPEYLRGVSEEIEVKQKEGIGDDEKTLLFMYRQLPVMSRFKIIKLMTDLYSEVANVD